MFKIKFLRLFSANKMVKEYEFDVITYVFGDNSHGKTLLAKSLDYVLGSTENMLINNIEGLEEITALSCVLIDDNRFVEFVRNKNGEYYIKYDINSEYSLVDDKKYKEFTGSKVNVTDIMNTIRKAKNAGLKIKINSVVIRELV